jgi:hypothetical protein
LSCGGNRLRWLRWVQDVHDNPVHLCVNSALDCRGLFFHPIGSADVSRQCSQFNSGLAQTVIKAVRQGINSRVGTVREDVYVQHSHVFLLTHIRAR